MIHRIIAQKTRQTFERVNRHDYESILKEVRPDMHHRFAGDHALGGERHDREHVRLWFERLGRVMPSLHLTVTDIWIKGGLRRAVVVARWRAQATLLDGTPYRNHGVHIVHLRNLKVASIDVNEDSQAVERALERQAQAGLEEARAAPITS